MSVLPSIAALPRLRFRLLPAHLKRRLTAALSFCLRLIVPASCPGCGVVLHKHALCAGCWKKLSFISSPFCKKYAVPFARDSAPDVLSPEAYRHPPPWEEARAAVLFKDLAIDLVHGLKYKDRHDYAPL